MSIFKDHIFIFDLHNTLYDEVMEYGGAMGAPIQHFFDYTKKQKTDLTEEKLHNLIAKGHAALGSDWDNDVWDFVAKECGLEDYAALVQETIDIRQKTSEALTKKYAYTDTIDAIKELKEQGAKLYLATEATANAAADVVRWLNLDGIFDGVYSWPFHKPYKKLKKTKQFFFPAMLAEENVYLQKPHPHIIAQIMLDIADIPNDIQIDDAFETYIDDSLNISSLEEKMKNNPESLQVRETLKAIQTRIQIKDGPYQAILQNLWQKCFYVGDSFFKDGFLARNTGLPFIHAAYGKIIEPQEEEQYKQASALLYAVTGWSPFLLQLTQEAGKLRQLTQQITPDFVCEKSLRDFIEKQ